MTKTILYGNGVNLLGGGMSWNQLLQHVSKKETLPQIDSNTLKYEYIILPQKEETSRLLAFKGKLLKFKGRLLTSRQNTEASMKALLCSELERKVPSFYYDKLFELDADNYITTNYELFLPQKFEIKPKYFDNIRLLHRFRSLEIDGRCKTFWNIHGDTETPKDIVLGLSDYCKYVAQIDDYLNPSEQEQSPCWIDLLFNTDVHILGLAMGYEEIDLWNVLTTRKRKLRAGSIDCQNNIYYYAIKDESYDTGKTELLKALDVNVVEIELKDNDFAKAYENIFNTIKST